MENLDFLNVKSLVGYGDNEGVSNCPLCLYINLFLFLNIQICRKTFTFSFSFCTNSKLFSIQDVECLYVDQS